MNKTSIKVGCGFRSEAYDKIIANLDNFEVMEFIVDHYLVAGDQLKEKMQYIASKKPVVLHGVGLSIGSATPLDIEYLNRVNFAAKELKAVYYSEHLSFTKANNIETAHLLPLPFRADVADILIEKIKEVKKYIQIPFLLENVSYYYQYSESELPEVEFVNTICRASDIGLLLDIENLRINSINNKYNPYHFINYLLCERVKYIHMAGGITHQNLELDTHDQLVSKESQNLLRYLLKLCTPDYIILERDGRLEEFYEVVMDCKNIKSIANNLWRLA